MQDRDRFAETLHLVQEVVKTSPTPLGKEEVMSYFQEIELTPEQENMVYQFLMRTEEPQVQEEDSEQEESQVQEKVLEAETDQVPDSTPKPPRGNRSTKYFEMYLQELEELSQVEQDKEAQLYARLMAGDETVIPVLTNQWLKRIVTIAQEYQGQACFVDDLVQEGNIALLTSLNQLLGSQGTRPAGRLPQELSDVIKGAMEEYMGLESGTGQQTETMLAKVALVHQAREQLKQEKGEMPSLRELADYTRIPQDEIGDILSLMKE